MSDLDDLARAAQKPSTRRRPPARPNAEIPKWVWIGGSVFLLAVIGQLMRDPAKEAQDKAAQRELRISHNAAVAQEGEKASREVQALLNAGSFTEVDYIGRKSRVKPIVWMQLSLALKQKSVSVFHTACGGLSCTILSSESDQVLAECDNWGSITIRR